MMIISIFILLLAFYALARVCDEYFIESLDQIAKKWKLSHEAAGATLMAIGSSAPEFFIAIITVFKTGGHIEMGAGTIVGSALFNILIIIGVATLIRTAHLTWQVMMRDLTFYALAVFSLLLTLKDGVVEKKEALLFLSIYIAYVISVVHWKKWAEIKARHWSKGLEKKMKRSKKSSWEHWLSPVDKIIEWFFPWPKKKSLTFIISIGLIAFLSWILVERSIFIAQSLNIPEAIIALTVLAIGTSIPDLIASSVVAKQGRGDMAISNAIGSNIFDILFGLGVPWLIAASLQKNPIAIQTEELMTSGLLLLGSIAVIGLIGIVNHWKIGKKTGWLLITLYLLYLIGIILPLSS